VLDDLSIIKEIAYTWGILLIIPMPEKMVFEESVAVIT
jgi:hypothetical protein